MREVTPRDEKIAALRDLLRLWVPDLGLERSLPVPVWFLMRRRPSQPPPQTAQLLATRAGADTRVRMALWTMLAGWHAQQNDMPAVLKVRQIRLSEALAALPAVGADRMRTKPMSRDVKQRNRQVYRTVETLKRVALVRRDEESLWILRPGRGPHELEPWSTTMRPDREDDPVADVPLWWFHHGWLNDLSGRAIVTLLTLHGFIATSQYKPRPGEWFLVPRVRGSRLAMDRRTWNEGIDELRGYRLVERARVAGTGRGAVSGDEFAYRLKEHDDAPLGRPRVGFDDVDARRAVDAQRLDLINRDPPGMRPVLYTPPRVSQLIFRPHSAFAGCKWYLSIRPWSRHHAVFRIDPRAALPGSVEWNDAVRALSYLPVNVHVCIQGDLGAGSSIGKVEARMGADHVERQLLALMQRFIGP